jgi:hypothetical protein
MKTLLSFVLTAFSFFISTSAMAQHLTQPDKLLQDITRGNLISKGCSITARLAIKELKVVGTAACVIPEPTGASKLACAVGLALRNRTAASLTETGMTSGCKWVVKNTSDKVVEVTIEVVKEAEASIADAKAWFSFLNTINGAIWFVNRLSGRQ